MREKKHNGWANYETWSTVLWLDNDDGAHYEMRDLARRSLDQNRLAQSIKDYVENMVSLDEVSLRTDLLSAALSEVDWYDIARHYWEDYYDDEDESENSTALGHN